MNHKELSDILTSAGVKNTVSFNERQRQSVITLNSGHIVSFNSFKGGKFSLFIDWERVKTGAPGVSISWGELAGLEQKAINELSVNDVDPKCKPNHINKMVEKHIAYCVNYENVMIQAGKNRIKRQEELQKLLDKYRSAGFKVRKYTQGDETYIVENEKLYFMINIFGKQKIEVSSFLSDDDIIETFRTKTVHVN